MRPDSPNTSQPPVANIPNLLCVLRILGSVVLVGIAYAQMPYWFVGLYLLFATTDLIDGPLARWLGQRSSLGATLDSVADIMLSVSLIFGAILLSGEWLKQEYWLIAPAVLSYLLAAGFGYWKFRKFPSYHTYAAKVTHLLVAIAGVCLILHWSIWPLRIAAFATLLTNLESPAISVALKEWRADVATFHSVYRRNLNGHSE